MVANTNIKHKTQNRYNKQDKRVLGMNCLCKRLPDSKLYFLAHTFIAV